MFPDVEVLFDYDICQFPHRYLGPVANYKMRKEEIRNKGLVLAVPDEFLKSCKVGNVLFRVWFQVRELNLT